MTGPIGCHCVYNVTHLGSSHASTQLYSYGSVASTHSHDTGLMGAILVVNPAYIVSTQQADQPMACDVDAEVFLTVTEISEAHSL